MILPQIVVNQMQGIRMSTLLLTANALSIVDNATNITCNVIIISPLSWDESEPALLLVQGISNKHYHYYNKRIIMLCRSISVSW